MKPKPLASLNHLTVPVVRIVPTPCGCGNRSADMRRTDRLRSVRELNPHAGLPAAARTRARERQEVKKGPAPTPAPLYSRRIAAQDIGRRAGSQAGDREPEALLAYLPTGE